MTANAYKWHLKILPEDDKWRQIAAGFHRELPQHLQRKVDICHVARGWCKGLELIETFKLDDIPDRHLLLLIDFDKREKERQIIIDDALQNHPRVFVLGSTREAEDLIASLGRGGGIACGKRFFSVDMQCSDALWQPPMLDNQRNKTTLLRLCPVLQQNLT